MAVAEYLPGKGLTQVSAQHNIIYSYNHLHQERIGLGLGFYADQNGPVASRGFNMAYAYHLNFSSSNLGVSYSGPQYFAGFAVNHILPLENKVKPGKKVKQDYVLHGG